MINRQNYEVWFVDFLDGKLTGDSLAQFHAFLYENPDLAAELHEISAELPSIPAETVKAPVAKKEIVPVGGVDALSFETFFIAYHENDLNVAERQQVQAFLDKNPFLRREFALFSQLTVAQSGESFPQKRKLKHAVPLAPMYRYAAAAASVLLLLGVGSIWYSGSQESGAGLAYRPVSVQVPTLAVTVPDADTTPWIGSAKKQHISPVQMPVEERRIRMEGIAANGLAPSVPLERVRAGDPELATSPTLYVPPSTAIASTQQGDEITLVQALGKVLETGVGQNSVSEGLKDDRKITAGDMVDLASTPFKKSGTPVLATENTTSGKRRIKLRLGIFEADFALK